MRVVSIWSAVLGSGEASGCLNDLLEDSWKVSSVKWSGGCWAGVPRIASFYLEVSSFPSLLFRTSF
jgi:hypothetical protein